MPAAGKRSSASIDAEPTMPKMSVTPCARSVSTNASLHVIRVLTPIDARPVADWSFMTPPSASSPAKGKLASYAESGTYQRSRREAQTQALDAGIGHDATSWLGES